MPRANRNLAGLSAVCGFAEVVNFQEVYRMSVGEALAGETVLRDDRWSEAIAVGSLAFTDKVKSELGFKAIHRKLAEVGGPYTLQEESEAYPGNFGSESDALRPENTIFWNENAENTET